MGSGGSKTDCPECNCESEMPRVIRKCESTVNKGASNTLVGAIDSLIGKKNSETLIIHYQNATGNGGLRPDLFNEEGNKWMTDFYDKTREVPNTNEGFIEGMEEEECIPCSCRQAADEVIKACEDSSKQSTNVVRNVISEGGNVMSENTRNRIGGLINTFNNENQETNNEWSEIYYPNILNTKEQMKNIKENYTNIEGFDSNLLKFTRDALDSRHARFKDTSQFIEDCKNNSYNSIKDFITSEKKQLDNLYNYYLTFVKDYETLYLNKESVAKIIYNKIDELEKIQSKIDSYKTNLHVDNRKNNYQSSNYDFYKNIYFFMLIIYYSLFVLYLIFSKFISEKQYNNKIILLILFIYLITPIILGYLINFIYQGYIYLLEQNNLKEDTKSYVDIVNNN